MYQSHYIGITSLKMVSKPCPLGFYRSLVAPPPSTSTSPKHRNILCFVRRACPSIKSHIPSNDALTTTHITYVPDIVTL